MNVAHVPGLSHNLLSLRRIADAGNKYIGTREGIRIVFAKSGDEIFVPSCGQLNGLLGYRTDRCSEKNVHAVIAPGARSTPSTAAIKSFTYTLAAKPAERCFVDLSRP